MKYPTEFNLRVAAKDTNMFDMSRKHVTTQDFGVIKPIECKVCFPGDKINLSVSQNTKVLNMPAPTFGSADMILRAFYVPINNIWKDFDSFVSGTKIATSATTLSHVDAPFIYAGDLWSYLTAGSIEGVSNPFFIFHTEPTENCDLIIPYYHYSESSSSFSQGKMYVDFTYLGRKLYDFLVSMGLKVPPVELYRSNIPGITPNVLIGYADNFTFLRQAVTDVEDDEITTAWNYASYKISVLPILAFWKFYLDWIIPARFLSNYADIRHLFDVKHFSDLSYEDILRMFSRVPVSFLQDDFFTTAFSNPFGYEDAENISGDLPVLTNPDPTAHSAHIDRDKGAITNSTSESDEYINMFTLKSLGALQDMVNRGKIAGSKIRDYLEATYGIRASDDALHISTYLGSQRVPINFESLQTTTDTYNETSGDGALMGTYAGVAKLENKPFNVKFDVDDKMHGFFFVTSEIQVSPSYTQGLAPEFRLLTKEDFFNPAFDALGVDAVPHSMLANIQYGNYSVSGDSWIADLTDFGITSPDDIFGFVQRYARYKCNFDNVSGDFLIRSLNTGLDSWYLSRMFALRALKEQYPLINEKFLQAIGDDSNESFDRIFAVANTSIDHFRTNFHIDLKMMRKMKSLRDTLEFEEGGKTIQKSINNGVQN